MSGTAPANQHNPEDRSKGMVSRCRNGGTGLYGVAEGTHRREATCRDPGSSWSSAGRRQDPHCRIRVQKPERFLPFCGHTRDARGSGKRLARARQDPGSSGRAIKLLASKAGSTRQGAPAGVEDKGHSRCGESPAPDSKPLSTEPGSALQADPKGPS